MERSEDNIEIQTALFEEKRNARLGRNTVETVIDNREGLLKLYEMHFALHYGCKSMWAREWNVVV